MPNFFDQFDEPVPAPRGGTVTIRPYREGQPQAAQTGNYFDQFDEAVPSAVDTSELSAALGQLKPAAPSTGRSALIGTQQGLLAGFGDELSGLAEASGLPVGTPPIITAPVGAARRLFGAEGADEAYRSARDRFREVQARAEAEHPYVSAGGQVAGAIGGALAPIGAVGRGATLAGNVARGGIVGAGLGAVQGVGEAPELSDVPLGAATGAGFGGAVGLAVPAAIGGVRRVISPFSISAEKRAAADTLRREGVTDITAGQQTGSRGLKYIESEMGGGATERALESQGEQFTQAALRRVGENATRASPEVIDRAFDRIGTVFDDVAERNNIATSKKLGFDLMRTLRDYNAVTGTATRAPLIEQTVTDVAAAAQANGGAIPGKFYSATRSSLLRKARGTRDPELKQAIGDIVGALDDAMEKSVSPADSAAWREARRQYRHMLVIEKAATGAGEQAAEGIITPARLRSALVAQDKRAYARGRSDLGDLARAGVALMTPLPQSGTAPRLAAQGVSHALTGAFGASIGGSQGGSEGALIGGLAGFAGPRLAARAALSRPGKRILTNQALAGPTGRGTQLLAQPARERLIDRRGERR